MNKTPTRKILLAIALVNLIVLYLPIHHLFPENKYLQVIISALYNSIIILMGYVLYLSVKTPNPFRAVVIKEINQNHNLFDNTKKLQIQINNTQFHREKIGFPALNEIKTQKVDTDFVLIFTKDYRTIRLHKDEVMNYCYALIESHYSYFEPGIHDIELQVKTTISNIKEPAPSKKQ